MNEKPNLIDNIGGNTMTEALRLIVGEDDGYILSDNTQQVDEARIATAYFSPSGFANIAPILQDIPSIRLLLGTEPIADSEMWRKQVGESVERFIAKRLRENLKKQEDDLRAERDHIPFERTATDAIRQLINKLQEGNMEVRRYEKHFLHAKAYIFSPAGAGGYGSPEAVIVGSSNLTGSGLSKNRELNLGRYDNPTVVQAKDWFNQLWDESTPFDLAAFFEDIFEPKTPFEIFLRVLWELYGDEIEEDKKEYQGLPLTDFQKHGVVRALRLIKEVGGVIVADEVGLGKTFIAGEILAHYQDKRQRALLVCPAALRDTSWKRFISDHQLFLEVVSFEQLSRDEQLFDKDRRPKAGGEKLARDIDEYQLVIIDEAHNYRNPDSPYRADALRALLYGKRKDLLMLTATPVNNSLWDLYNLTRFFIKQDSLLAEKGILSIRDRFNLAMKTDPNSLSPDVLYPIIDATTVKRTRQFIKKHYPNDEVKINGEMQTIVFPEPHAISVRYNLDDLMPELFDVIETYFNPEDPDCIQLARYKSDTYLLIPDEDSERIAHAVTGLLLSGLLKRFESSTGAFNVSIGRLIKQHQRFLKALEEGYVVSTAFLKDSTGTDDEEFEELLEYADEADRADANLYDQEALREDVESDLKKLEQICAMLKDITPDKDPKLIALVKELEAIAEEAEKDGTSRESKFNNRKTLIFSFFADTTRWVYNYLEREIETNPKLAPYKNRLDSVVGSGVGEDSSKARAAAKFAPKTAGREGETDETDILVSTDVLAEGVNLQQARHIINYDMPWNPMRLVQRHGRIDRIGSQHPRVFMRTIFPVDRLDALLNLEECISRKIAMAAVSVGVVSPIHEEASSDRVFTETKAEINKLLEEDASLYERGGTVSGTQSGEEYRQTLRKAMEAMHEEITKMPWKAGSGMRKGKEQGIFFCAKVGERTYLRFVHATENWTVKQNEAGIELIEHEIGRCLRLIECPEDEELVLNEEIQDAAYDLWLSARRNIHKHWMHETDPANLQPNVRPLNRKVAEFIRKNTPLNSDQKDVDNALNIVEAPWSARDENRLRKWFNEEMGAKEKTKYLVEKIIESGLEPFKAPEPLLPIREEDIELLVWMGISSVAE